MQNADVVVVGGSAAGITAAVTAKRHYPDKRVLLVRMEEKVLIPCGIPYIFGTVGTPDKNLIPDTVLEKGQVEHVIAEVTSIDREKKLLHTSQGEIGYGKLILATGSLPSKPPIPGADKAGVFTIVKDVAQIQKLQMELRDAKDVVIIGGGFIGIEFADEIMKSGGKTITIVEIAPHCLSLSYDEEFCIEAEDALRTRGIQIRANTKVTGIHGTARVEGVTLSDGQTLKADLVLLGTGATPNVKLAKDAGLRIGYTGAIVVDRTMRTSDTAIYACGDCAKKFSFFGGRPSKLMLASIATLEARIAGANLFGITRENPGTVGVWSTAIGELALGTAGLTETVAKADGYDVVTALVEGPNRHPGCMPGATNMKVKLLFEHNSGVLLGGQVRGSSAAGEMLNVIAACVQKRMTAEDIAMFQMGTHPALTASPVVYPLTTAAEIAITKIRKKG